jgi:hypothetical protein
MYIYCISTSIVTNRVYVNIDIVSFQKFDIPTSKVEQSNLVSVERLKEGTNVSLKTGRNTHSFEVMISL